MSDDCDKPRISPGSLASHIVLWIVILCVLAWLVWSATHTSNKSTANTFASGSKQTNTYHVARNYALASLSLVLSPFTWNGCTRIPPEQVEQSDAKEANNDVQINALINSDKP